MTERFLNIINIDFNNFLYYDCKENSYAICDKKDMIKWQENDKIQLKLKYISNYEAKRVSVSVNSEDDFNQKVDNLHVLQFQNNNPKEILNSEIHKMKLNQISRLEYIQEIMQKQFKILDNIDRFIYPELFKVIEESITRSRLIFAQESMRYETEISETETLLKNKISETEIFIKNQSFDDAVKEQQEFTEFLKNKFKPQSYLYLPE